MSDIQEIGRQFVGLGYLATGTWWSMICYKKNKPLRYVVFWWIPVPIIGLLMVLFG